MFEAERTTERCLPQSPSKLTNQPQAAWPQHVGSERKCTRLILPDSRQCFRSWSGDIHKSVLANCGIGNDCLSSALAVQCPHSCFHEATRATVERRPTFGTPDYHSYDHRSMPMPHLFLFCAPHDESNFFKHVHCILVALGSWTLLDHFGGFSRPSRGLLDHCACCNLHRAAELRSGARNEK